MLTPPLAPPQDRFKSLAGKLKYEVIEKIRAANRAFKNTMAAIEASGEALEKADLPAEVEQIDLASANAFPQISMILLAKALKLGVEEALERFGSESTKDSLHVVQNVFGTLETGAKVAAAAAEVGLAIKEGRTSNADQAKALAPTVAKVGLKKLIPEMVKAAGGQAAKVTAKAVVGIVFELVDIIKEVVNLVSNIQSMLYTKDRIEDIKDDYVLAARFSGPAKDVRYLICKYLCKVTVKAY